MVQDYIGVASTDNIVTGTRWWLIHMVISMRGMTVGMTITFYKYQRSGTSTYEDVTNIDSVGIITVERVDINGDLL